MGRFRHCRRYDEKSKHTIRQSGSSLKKPCEQFYVQSTWIQNLMHAQVHLWEAKELWQKNLAMVHISSTTVSTSFRIVEDISALPRVLYLIIKSKGCVVNDEFLRIGRRSRHADDKGNLMHKHHNSQRKDVPRARPQHRDAEHAIDLIRSGGRVLPVVILD